MRILLTCLLLSVVNVSYADCSVNSFGQMVDSHGLSCSKTDSTYRQSGNNLFGNTPDNMRESYNTFNGGKTWNSTTPSSSLGVDTSVNAPNPYLNQNKNSGIGWNPIRP